MENQVISGYRAIVDGKAGGFAGCSNKECTRQCLRKDPQLVVLHDHNSNGGHCDYWIPVVKV